MWELLPVLLGAEAKQAGEAIHEHGERGAEVKDKTLMGIYRMGEGRRWCYTSLMESRIMALREVNTDM